jgi:hypothetical protein
MFIDLYHFVDFNGNGGVERRSGPSWWFWKAWIDRWRSRAIIVWGEGVLVYCAVLYILSKIRGLLALLMNGEWWGAAFLVLQSILGGNYSGALLDS